MGIQTSFSRLGSSAQCTHALVFIEEGPLSPVPTSQPSQNLMALRLQARYLPWPLRLGGYWHNTEEKRSISTHISHELCWEPPVATKAGSKLVTGGARNGLAAHKEVLVYAKFFFCECIHLLLKRKTFRFGGERLFCCLGFLREIFHVRYGGYEKSKT